MPRAPACSKANAEWAHCADEILREHGAVCGGTLYRERHQARYQAQKLMRLMVQLGLHERCSLREHTEPRRGGWGWAVEYVFR